MALKDYLASRRAEIEGQIKALRHELGEIRIAEAALNGTTADTEQSASRSGRVREGSIKDWILKVLVKAPARGFETEEIMNWVEITGGPAVPRNSMTPQLSRLKAAGLIDLDGRYWRLVQTEVLETETPDANASGAPMPDEEVFDDMPV